MTATPAQVQDMLQDMLRVPICYATARSEPEPALLPLDAVCEGAVLAGHLGAQLAIHAVVGAAVAVAASLHIHTQLLHALALLLQAAEGSSSVLRRC